MDGDVRDRILALPRAKELAQQASMPGLDELRRRFSARLSDEEFLLRAVMPADQVDAMVASGPADVASTRPWRRWRSCWSRWAPARTWTMSAWSETASGWS
jgi:hypothetical protein